MKWNWCSLSVVLALVLPLCFLAGCAAPRAVAGVTKGVVKGTSKVVTKTGKVLSKPLR